jgi:AraC-like DNA-binding protein
MTLYPETRSLALSHPEITISEHFPFRIGIPRIPSHFPAHRHEYLEISFILEGSGYQVINGKRHSLLPGTFFFLLPYQVHEIFTESDQPLRLYNCMFDMNFLFLSSALVSGLDQLLYIYEELPPSIQPEGDELDVFKRLFAEMLAEFEGDRLWRNHFLQMKLLELLIRFDRLRRQEKVSAPSPDPVGTRSIWSIIRNVHLRYQEPLTLSGLAEQYGMSLSHLSEEFKKHTGVNFVHFLRDVRFRHACGLLASSDMSEIDIAAEAGFGSFRSFSRTFRELKEMTPGKYRAWHKNNRSRFDSE